ncbi:hypothetical protein A0O32_2508 [Anoxybacillus flavithermus]|nr:hypothetical protein A0O32_2508 [Anoxybacillus flavithermus]
MRDYRIWLQEKGIDATTVQGGRCICLRNEAKTVEVGRTQGLKRCYERSSR